MGNLGSPAQRGLGGTASLPSAVSATRWHRSNAIRRRICPARFGRPMKAWLHRCEESAAKMPRLVRINLHDVRAWQQSNRDVFSLTGGTEVLNSPHSMNEATQRLLNSFDLCSSLIEDEHPERPSPFKCRTRFSSNFIYDERHSR